MRNIIILFTILCLTNSYADCISTEQGSAEHVPVDSGINKLIEQNCDVNNSSHREVILNQKIKAGEEINADSMNLKIKAIDLSINNISNSEYSGVTFSGDTTGFNIISPTEISGSGSFIYATETCTGDCFIEFKVKSLAGGNYPQVGLAGDTYPYSQAVAFDSSGNIVITSNGGYDSINIVTYQVGDVFKVSIEGTSVVYYKNGISFYTKNSISGASPYRPMFNFNPSFHIENINFVDVAESP